MEYWVAKFPKTVDFKHFLARMTEIKSFDIEFLRSHRWNPEYDEFWFYENKPGMAEEIRQKLQWLTSLTLHKPLLLEVVRDSDESVKEVTK